MVAERRRFFLTSFLPLIEILQNDFVRLHNCNNHTTLNFHSDSQVDLKMNKASNFIEESRNRKNHTKPYVRILEATRIQVSSDTDVNVLLSRNNYLQFGIIYPTGRFYKDNSLRNHKNQAALIKLSKRVSAVLLGDSIIAGFLRYPNIWHKFFDENTTNCGIGGDKVQNVLWRTGKIPPPQSLEYVVISCGTNKLDTEDFEKIADGIFCIALALKKRMNHVKIVINGVLLRGGEQNTVRRQKLFIANELLESKCTNYVNTNIHYLSPDGDWIRENGCLDIALFYKYKLHLIERECFKLTLSIKRKISLFKKKTTNTQNNDKRQKPFFNANNLPTLISKRNTNTSKQDYSSTMSHASSVIYSIQATPASNETYLLQSQPNTKKSYPQKRKLSFQHFFLQNRLKHNQVQYQCQGN